MTYSANLGAILSLIGFAAESFSNIVAPSLAHRVVGQQAHGNADNGYTSPVALLTNAARSSRPCNGNTSSTAAATVGN
jgi:hypothetical protein